jgi:hypothetical protein
MFKFGLVLENGSPADPATFTTAVPGWKAADTIPLGPGRSLRVVEVREGVLVVAQELALGNGHHSPSA